LASAARDQVRGSSGKSGAGKATGSATAVFVFAFSVAFLETAEAAGLSAASLDASNATAQLHAATKRIEVMVAS
jgi:hypothetical protein